MSDKPRVLFIQPALASYRRELVEQLVSRFDLKVLSDSGALEREGFASGLPPGVAFVEAPIREIAGGRLLMQSNVINTILNDRPAVVLTFANPRLISLWLLALLCRALGIRVVAHGQGLYQSPNAAGPRALTYRVLCRLTDRFICYTDRTYQSLLAAGCPPGKLRIAENSLLLANPVAPHEKSYDEPGVLYVGRLREGSGVRALIEAGMRVQAQRPGWQLHLVGGGPLEAALKHDYAALDWIVWHGAVYDDARVSEISRQCRLAVYPGNAGLSVVHYFGLSLPMLIHDRLSSHFPEAEYALDGKTAWLFAYEHGLADSLDAALERPPNALREVATNAHEKYRQLNSPSLGVRITDLVDETLKGRPASSASSRSG